MSGVIRTVPCGCESGQPCTPATRCAITTAVHIQREDDEAEMERLREDHEAELAALRERAERAEAALLRKGYRMSCDIPACNCGDQWTHGGHAEMRLTEIREALEQADARRNGETLLADVVHIAARAERATTIEAELAALRAELQKVRSAAISGMDAATQHGYSLVQQAARLKAESNPDALESERAANALLTEQLQKAEAELAALRADAERYRWLRDKYTVLLLNGETELRITHGPRANSKSGIDDVIDAARGDTRRGRAPHWGSDDKG